MAGLHGHHGSPVVAFTLKKNSAMEREGEGGGGFRSNDIDDNYVIINIMSMVDVVITKIWGIKLDSQK